MSHLNRLEGFSSVQVWQRLENCCGGRLTPGFNPVPDLIEALYKLEQQMQDTIVYTATRYDKVTRKHVCTIVRIVDSYHLVLYDERATTEKEARERLIVVLVEDGVITLDAWNDAHAPGV